MSDSKSHITRGEWDNHISAYNILSGKVDALEVSTDKKLDKVNTATVAYITDSTGAQTTKKYGYNLNGNALVARDNNGRFHVAAGIADTHAINKGQLDAEATARTNADNTLQTSLSNEITARENADNTLQTNLETEATNRANADDNLQDQIDDLKARGRYLSTWDSTTGKPTTDPTTLPYSYKSGDYYIVNKVSDTTNYKPDGTTYTGAASTTLESDKISVNDTYYYDGTKWSLIAQGQKSITFSSIAGEPSDNTKLNAAFSGKQDKLTAASPIEISSDVISLKDDGVTLAKLAHDTSKANCLFMLSDTGEPVQDFLDVQNIKKNTSATPGSTFVLKSNGDWELSKKWLDNVFINYGVDTYTEAYNKAMNSSGKVVWVVDEDGNYTINSLAKNITSTDTLHLFCDAGERYFDYTVKKDGDVWNKQYYLHETMSNRKTSLSSSSNDTYPTTKAVTDELDKKLSLTGGTMNGSIKSKTDDILVATDNKSSVNLCGGISSGTGGRFAAYGKEHESLPGYTTMTSLDSSGFFQLSLSPQGALELKNGSENNDVFSEKNVSLSETGTSTTEFNYIKLAEKEYKVGAKEFVRGSITDTTRASMWAKRTEWQSSHFRMTYAPVKFKGLGECPNGASTDTANYSVEVCVLDSSSGGWGYMVAANEFGRWTCRVGVNDPSGGTFTSWEKFSTNESAFLREYPVGARYMQLEGKPDPNTLGGTWVVDEKYDNRVLWADTGQYQGIKINQGLPKPTIVSSFSGTEVVASASGSHNHTFTGTSGTTSSTGKHSHTRGTMEISGTIGSLCNQGGKATGCFSYSKDSSAELSGDNQNRGTWTFTASNNWTGATSEQADHSHTLTPKGTINTIGNHAHLVTAEGTVTSGVGTDDIYGNSSRVQPAAITYTMWVRTA